MSLSFNAVNLHIEIKGKSVRQISQLFKLRFRIGISEETKSQVVLMPTVKPCVNEILHDSCEQYFSLFFLLVHQKDSMQCWTDFLVPSKTVFYAASSTYPVKWMQCTANIDLVFLPVRQKRGWRKISVFRSAASERKARDSLAHSIFLHLALALAHSIRLRVQWNCNFASVSNRCVYGCT